MQCLNCEFDNPEGMKFCGRCGTKLANICPACEFANPSEFQFCGKCGTKLEQETAPSPTEVKPVEPSPSAQELSTSLSTTSEAERRQITVMFCDLVGSTALSARLDPEELRDVVREYQAVCAQVIARYEGHIAQYLGDGILVYFGYPMAHEDDAHRAVRSGLGIIEAMDPLNHQLQQNRGIRLDVRLGLHTGLVVVGEMGAGDRYEQLALGEAPNIAARLEGLAEPNTLVISAATYRLVEGFFDCRHLGAQALHGIAQAMAVYRVLHESRAKSRLDVAEIAGLTPMVGRAAELNQLLSYWEQAKAGKGHVILLQGEAGLGKSRLVWALKEHVSSESDAWLVELRCSPYHTNSAFHPIIDLFERIAPEFQQEDSSIEKLSKIEGFLVQHGFPVEEGVPLFANLLSVPLNEPYAPLSMTPERQKQKLLEILLAVLLRRSVQQPVLFVAEDLQWMDASTLELITLIVDQEPTNRVLTLLTFRPEFTPPWGIRPHLIPISLKHLPEAATIAIIQQVTGEKKLPEEVLKQIISKTDGIPLFVEEITKMVIESGLLRETEDRYELRGLLQPLAIPTTLHDSLLARLDRLATAKEIAQLSATLGRDFNYALIEAVSLLEETSLQNGLAQLVKAGLLYQRGVPPMAMYQFKHALIQDAAYQSLLKSKRQLYHQQIAQVLTEQFPESAHTEPELLAHHYTEASLIEQAIFYWHRAGERAVGHSANLEAVAHLSKGLELLQTVPDTAERAQQELKLQLTLSIAIGLISGWGAPQIEQTYTRMWELCQQVGSKPQISSALFTLHRFYSMRGELQMALKMGQELMKSAQNSHDPSLLMPAHLTVGVAQFWFGEFVPAQEHLNQCIAIDDPELGSHFTALYGSDIGLLSFNFAAWNLCHLGHLDEARERTDQALAKAQEQSHTFSQVAALGIAAIVHQCRREPHLAQERAEAAMTLSDEQGFTFWSTWATAIWGWALAEQGRTEEGITQIRKGLAGSQAARSTLFCTCTLVLLAEAYRKVGLTEEGLTVLNEARAAIEKTEHRQYEAEVYRLQAEFLLMTGKTDSEVEACFLKALEIARRQQAKVFELRTVISLSRLWQRQGKKEEALKVLEEIYQWFNEGLDTADLVEAKALLEELSAVTS
ncbi:MAG: AAA family ATPase [Candidatus Poribacteria bacterium]|nr:AAA family ATPase [Candidatus Poribacteria bacterium]